MPEPDWGTPLESRPWRRVFDDASILVGIALDTVHTRPVGNGQAPLRQRVLLSMGVGAVLVAVVASCNQGNSDATSSGESTTPTGGTTAIRSSPNGSPAPGTYTSPPASGDQASAESAIEQGYDAKLADCDATHDAVADIVAITWNAPGFKEGDGGSGMIRDENPSLGGDFVAMYRDGHWNVVYNWC